jgi:hypothetical protein
VSFTTFQNYLQTISWEKKMNKVLLSITAASAILLSGCLFSDDDGEAGGSVEGTKMSSVVSHDESTLITNDEYQYCESGDLVVESSTDTTNYSISNDTLYVYDEDGDVESVMTGGTTLLDTWYPTGEDTTYMSSVTINDDGIYVATTLDDDCPTDMYEDMEEEGFTVVDCNTVTLDMMGTEMTMSFNAVGNNGTMEISTSANGTTCTQTEYSSEDLTETICADEEAAQAEYDECMMNLFM